MSCVVGLAVDGQAVILLDRHKGPRKLLAEAKARGKADELGCDDGTPVAGPIRRERPLCANLDHLLGRRDNRERKARHDRCGIPSGVTVATSEASSASYPW